MELIERQARGGFTLFWHELCSESAKLLPEGETGFSLGGAVLNFLGCIVKHET